MDKEDMTQLKIYDGQNVCLENDVGKVVVTARQTEDESHPGLGFMTNSPWSNQLVRAESVESVIPKFKAIEIRVSASNKDVTKLSELLERMRR
jgi:formylmethanofuran dehydrogenase subunit D